MNGASPPRMPDPPPSIDGSIQFFYYDDLDAATRWYQDILGLETILHEEWLVLLQLRARTIVGLVDAAGGSHLPLRGGNQGAMLSIESDALETWLGRFKMLGICAATTALTPGCRGRTLEFRVRDPGGYMIEFFRWTDRP